MKFYCQKCGHPNDSINNSKPNFCSKCGNSFVANASTQVKQQTEARKNIIIEHDNDGDVDDEGLFVPDIDSLKFSYDKSFKNKNKISIESLAKMSGKDYKRQNIEKSDFKNSYSIEDFKNEAGSIRNKKSSE
jgi:predicted  nucleic acid-binding Zn-ribbon protein